VSRTGRQFADPEGRPPSSRPQQRPVTSKRRRTSGRPPVCDPTATRICTKCGREKPLDAFPPHKRCRLGRNTQCRDCINAYQRAYHRQHLERSRAKYRRFYHRHKDRIAGREQRLDRKAKNDIRQLVRLAVRTGLLTKPKRCERCGQEPPPHRLHAHHPDYTRPLDVAWLCSLCHGKEHARLRAEESRK